MSALSDTLIYNIPSALLPAYQGRRLILRTSDPAALIAQWPQAPPAGLVCVQLLDLPIDIADLLPWGEEVPLDIVLDDPITDHPKLYRYSKLIDNHPVRVTLPVVSGFGKAVKLAAALQFAVKLKVGQPDPGLIDELAEVLDYYLHDATASQPIDYFHEVLLAFLRDTPGSLWAVQEEDPTQFCYVTEQGEQIWPSCPAGVAVEPDRFVEYWQERLLAEGAECCDCEFRPLCGAYFKQPQRDYDCTGVKRLFRMLHNAADELQQDLIRSPAATGAFSP